MKRFAYLIFIYGAIQGMASEHPFFKATTKAEIKKCLANGYNVNSINLEGKTALIQAGIAKNFEVFFALLEAQADVLAIDNDGLSVFDYIHRSALESLKNDPPFLIHMMACLIERGAAFNSASPFLVAILCKSASFGYANAVRRIVEAGVPINSLDHYGQTALQLAAKLLEPAGASLEAYRPYNHSKIDVARFLIESGANINLCTQEAQSALTLAIESNYDTMAKLLLAFPTLNVQQGRVSHGLGAFGAAVERQEAKWGPSRKRWREVAQLIVRHPSFQPQTENDVLKSIAYGRDINTRDTAGMTSLMHAILTQNVQTFFALMSARADIFATDNEGVSAFDYAHALALQVNEKDVLIHMMACLIDQNVAFDQTSPLLTNILYKSAAFGYANTVKRILDTDLITQDQKDRALHWSAVKLTGEGESESKHKPHNERKLGIAKTILQAGANINRTTNIGQTPLALAIEGDYKPMIKFLLTCPGINVRIGVLSSGISIYTAAVQEYDTTWFANRIAWDEIVQLIEKHPSFRRPEEQ